MKKIFPILILLITNVALAGPKTKELSQLKSLTLKQETEVLNNVIWHTELKNHASDVYVTNSLDGDMALLVLSKFGLKNAKNQERLIEELKSKHFGNTELDLIAKTLAKSDLTDDMKREIFDIYEQRLSNIDNSDYLHEKKPYLEILKGQKSNPTDVREGILTLSEVDHSGFFDPHEHEMMSDITQSDIGDLKINEVTRNRPITKREALEFKAYTDKVVEKVNANPTKANYNAILDFKEKLKIAYKEFMDTVHTSEMETESTRPEIRADKIK